jgi:hypothetical protein
MQRHPRITVALLNCLVLAVLFVIAEYALRAVGFSYTRKPNPFILEDTFHVNDRGLFTANPASTTHRAAGIAINHDGFRSPEFPGAPPAKKTKTSVAIIGDSFAWGATATPISRSFADLLRNSGYEVYNFGIPGTGPLQYLHVAETYLPRLKPDIVVVALYLGNDILPKEYDPPPGRPLYYVIKGGGWIMPFDENGNYIESVDAAYEHLHNSFGRLRRFLRETAIGTLFIQTARMVQTWVNARRAEATIPSASSNASDPNIARVLQQYAQSYSELRKIQEFAQQLPARFYLFVIPALGKGCLPSSDFDVKVQRPALAQFHPLYLELSDAHYNAVPDCHLNNSGHAAAAQVLLRLLSR